MTEMVSVSREKLEAAIEREFNDEFHGSTDHLPPELKARAENAIRNALWIEWTQPELYAEIAAKHAAETQKGQA